MLRHAIIMTTAVVLFAGTLTAQDKAKAPDAEKPAAAKAPDKKAPAKKEPAKAPDKNAAKDADKDAAKAKPQPLKVTVTEVSGIAEKRSAADEKAEWTQIKVGDVLGEMTLIRTGLGGKVVLKFAERGNVTVKNGTKIGIASFRKQGKLVRTRLGLKYGALRAKVDSTQGANDFRLRTAGGTLAAKGSEIHAARWGDFALQFKGMSGTWEAKVGSKLAEIFAGEWTDAELNQPVETLLLKLNIQLGDPHGGLTKAELLNLLRYGGGRGILGFIGNPNTGAGGRTPLIPKIPCSSGSSPPPVKGISPPPPIGGSESRGEFESDGPPQ